MRERVSRIAKFMLRRMMWVAVTFLFCGGEAEMTEAMEFVSFYLPRKCARVAGARVRRGSRGCEDEEGDEEEPHPRGFAPVGRLMTKSNCSSVGWSGVGDPSFLPLERSRSARNGARHTRAANWQNLWPLVTSRSCERTYRPRASSGSSA